MAPQTPPAAQKLADALAENFTSAECQQLADYISVAFHPARSDAAVIRRLRDALAAAGR